MLHFILWIEEGNMQKCYRRVLNGALFCLMGASLIGISACSKTPIQNALDSDPDTFAQAVNGNFYAGGAFFLRTDCIHAVVDPSFRSVLVKKGRYSDLNFSADQVIKECSPLFSSLASEMNKNTQFKGLTEKDFEQKPIWEHYYKSSMAHFDYKDGDDE